ncbi:hypothetical protein ACIOWI_36305, partial [Streptomyces sp. NPDC087659]
MSVGVPSWANDLMWAVTGERFLQADEDLAFASADPFAVLATELLRVADEIERRAVATAQSLPEAVGQQYLQLMRELVTVLREWARELEEVAAGRAGTTLDIVESKGNLFAELAWLAFFLGLLTMVGFFSAGGAEGVRRILIAKARVRLLAIGGWLTERTRLAPVVSEAAQEVFMALMVRVGLIVGGWRGLRRTGVDGKDIGASALVGALAAVGQQLLSGAGGKLKATLGLATTKPALKPSSTGALNSNTGTLSHFPPHARPQVGGGKHPHPTTGTAAGGVGGGWFGPGGKAKPAALLLGAGAGAGLFVNAAVSESSAEAVVNATLYGQEGWNWNSFLSTGAGAGISAVTGAIAGAGAVAAGAAAADALNAHLITTNTGSTDGNNGPGNGTGGNSTINGTGGTGKTPSTHTPTGTSTGAGAGGIGKPAATGNPITRISGPGTVGIIAGTAGADTATATELPAPHTSTSTSTSTRAGHHPAAGMAAAADAGGAGQVGGAAGAISSAGMGAVKGTGGVGDAGPGPSAGAVSPGTSTSGESPATTSAATAATVPGTTAGAPDSSTGTGVGTATGTSGSVGAGTATAPGTATGVGAGGGSTAMSGGTPAVAPAAQVPGQGSVGTGGAARNTPATPSASPVRPTETDTTPVPTAPAVPATPAVPAARAVPVAPALPSAGLAGAASPAGAGSVPLQQVRTASQSTGTGRTPDTESARSAGSDQIVALPVTTPFDAWNAFEVREKAKAGAVLSAVLKMLPVELQDPRAVKQRYASLTEQDQQASVRVQATALHNLIAHGRKRIGLVGGARSKKKEQAADGRRGGSGAASGQSVPVSGSQSAGPGVDQAPGLATGMVRQLNTAVKETGRISKLRHKDVLSLAERLWRVLPWPSDLSLAALVEAVAWVGEKGQEGLQAELLKHPQVVYAVARQKHLKVLLTGPEEVQALGNASSVLEALAAQTDAWYKSHGQKTGRFLLREEVASELEADPDLRAKAFGFPGLLSNLKGRLDLVREVLLEDGMPVYLTSQFPDFGHALLEQEDPIETVWRLGGQGGLAAALYSQSRKYPERSFLDVFRLVMADGKLGEVIRRCPAQLNLVVSSTEILQAVQATPEALFKLSESPVLTDVLEEDLSLAGRLLSDVELMTVAVDNKSVAYALSCEPHRYDSITADKDRLKEALASTRMPQGFPVPADDDAAADTNALLREAARTLALEDSEFDPRSVDSVNPESRYALVQTLLDMDESRLPQTLLPPEDGDAAVAGGPFRDVVEHLRQNSPAVHTLLASRSESDMQLVKLLRSREFEDVVRYMVRCPRVITMPHQLRRVLGLSPTLLQLPEQPYAALYLLMTAARHTLIKNVLNTPFFGERVRLTAQMIMMLPDLRAHLYGSPALTSLAAGDMRPVQQVAAELLAANPWLATTVERQLTVLYALPKVDPEKSAGMSALLAEDAALLRLMHQRRLANELTNEEWAAMVDAVNSSAGLLKPLVPVFGKLPTAYWKRLLTGDLYGLLSERQGLALTKALIRFPRVLREAIARPGFTRMWQAQPELGEDLADRALQAGDSAGADAAVQALAAHISESAGEVTLTPEGFELAPELVEPLKVLTGMLGSGETLDTSGGAVPDFLRDVADAYNTVLGDERLREAAVSNAYLAQGLLFTPGMLDLLTTRPSLVRQIKLHPEMLRQLMNVPGLPALLASQDASYDLYTNSGPLRENYNANYVAICERSPYMDSALHTLNHMAGSAGSVHANGLLQRSHVLARAVVEREATLGELLHSPGLVQALTSLVEADREGVVRAVVGSQERVEACAADLSLVKVVAGLPEEVVTVLGDRCDVASSAAGWAGLLKDRALVAELSAHPGLA